MVWKQEDARQFCQFSTGLLGISGPEYKTLTELENAGLGYDLLVCGSDQIWNPSEHFGIDPVYFWTSLQRVKLRAAFRMRLVSAETKLILNTKRDWQR